jgi:hypothetical protein
LELCLKDNSRIFSGGVSRNLLDIVVARFETFMAVKFQFKVFWVVMPLKTRRP